MTPHLPECFYNIVADLLGFYGCWLNRWGDWPHLTYKDAPCQFALAYIDFVNGPC